MGNYLQMSTQQQIRALLEIGWSHRRIARELDVHRETVARYAVAKPASPIIGSANEPEDQNQPSLITGTDALVEGQNRPNPITGPESPAADHHEFIAKQLDKGLTAQRIWQDLVELHGYEHGYQTVQRYVKQLKRTTPEVADRMEHPPGQEGQIDFFKSKAPVYDERRHRWSKPWVFRMTLSCSKHGYEESLPDRKLVTFLRAHEHAFMELGVPRVVRMDNTTPAVTRACLFGPDVPEVHE